MPIKNADDGIFKTIESILLINEIALDALNDFKEIEIDKESDIYPHVAGLESCLLEIRKGIKGKYGDMFECKAALEREGK